MPQGGPKMGPGGKVPGGPKPKNMKKTIGILLKYVGKHKGLLFIIILSYDSCSYELSCYGIRLILLKASC